MDVNIPYANDNIWKVWGQEVSPGLLISPSI